MQLVVCGDAETLVDLRVTSVFVTVIVAILDQWWLTLYEYHLKNLLLLQS